MAYCAGAQAAGASNREAEDSSYHENGGSGLGDQRRSSPRPARWVNPMPTILWS